jgi:hypothetical protein
VLYEAGAIVLEKVMYEATVPRAEIALEVQLADLEFAVLRRTSSSNAAMGRWIPDSETP